jgi:hypothetical protein
MDDGRRCSSFAGVIGVYEAAIFVEPNGERVTSRAAEGQALVRSRDAYHRACYPLD